MITLGFRTEPAGGARVLGFGAARPDHAVDAGCLGAPFGKDAAWVEQRTGIRHARRAVDTAEVLRLADRAAADALAAAGTDEGEIDLVLTASCSVANGPHDVGDLARSIAPRALHAQLNAACSGFSYALAGAHDAVRTGAARRVLIVAAEHMSRLLDSADLGTSIIFGDGAGAAVVGGCSTRENGIGPTVWGSDGSGRGLIACDLHAPNWMRMAGSQVFRWAVEQLPRMAREACQRAGVSLGDIEVFVPHQANKRIVDAAASSLGLDAIVADSITTTGNTSAASIPIAVVDLARRGATRTGQLALLAGFGAGLSYAAQVVRLP